MACPRGSSSPFELTADVDDGFDGGESSCPRSVNEYSTVGGEVGSTRRDKMPSASSFLSRAVKTLTEASFVTGEVLHVHGGAHAGKW